MHPCDHNINLNGSKRSWSIICLPKKKKMINYLLQDMWIDSHICQAPCMLMFSREKKCGYTIVHYIVKIYSKYAFGYRLFCWKLKKIKINFWITVHTKVTIDKSECTVHVPWTVNSARGAGLKKESQKCRREKTQTQMWTNQTDTKRFIP